MDTGMRDLAQIEEAEPEGPGRRVATLLLAALCTVGLVFAMGILLGRSADAASEPSRDPLAALDRALAEDRDLDDDGDLEAEDEMVEVRREELTFPETLSGYDTRPEVEAALAAAAAELAHPEPLPGRGPAFEPWAPAPAALPIPAIDALPHAVPAATAAGPSLDALAQALPHDPMVQAALPAAAPQRPRASPGREGRYMLQVISYATSHEAEAFAEGLRARGHTAFVTSADVPDRGRFYRVRIGPFETMREAESYREAFETDERMNTLVVRQRDEDDA